MEFHVRWIGDKLDSKRQINKTFAGVDERQYLYENQFAGKQPGEQPDPHGYALNKEVCRHLVAKPARQCSCAMTI